MAAKKWHLRFSSGFHVLLYTQSGISTSTYALVHTQTHAYAYTECNYDNPGMCWKFFNSYPPMKIQHQGRNTTCRTQHDSTPSHSPPTNTSLALLQLTMPWCPSKSSASIQAHTFLVPFLEHSLLYFSVLPLQRPPRPPSLKWAPLWLCSFFKTSCYNSELRFVCKFTLYHLSWHTGKPPWYNFSF